MFKLIFAIMLIVVGIGIGIQYQDPIMDALNMRDMEDVQDSLEDAKDTFNDSFGALSDTVSQLAQ